MPPFELLMPTNTCTSRRAPAPPTSSVEYDFNPNGAAPPVGVAVAVAVRVAGPTKSLSGIVAFTLRTTGEYACSAEKRDSSCMQQASRRKSALKSVREERCTSGRQNRHAILCALASKAVDGMTQPASAEVGEYQANVLLVACCMQEEWATHLGSFQGWPVPAPPGRVAARRTRWGSEELSRRSASVSYSTASAQDQHGTLRDEKARAIIQPVLFHHPRWGSGAATSARRGESPFPANRPAVPSSPGYILQADGPNVQKALLGGGCFCWQAHAKTNPHPIAPPRCLLLPTPIFLAD